MYGNLSITTATSEINETVESMSRFLTTNRNIELLEPYEGKLSRTVLRGEGGSNALDLPDIQKQGDFFVDSPIILLAAIIWYLKIYEGGKYCTFPHAIELLCKRYEDIFTILTSYPELENFIKVGMSLFSGHPFTLHGLTGQFKQYSVYFFISSFIFLFLLISDICHFYFKIFLCISLLLLLNLSKILFSYFHL